MDVKSWGKRDVTATSVSRNSDLQKYEDVRAKLLCIPVEQTASVKQRMLAMMKRLIGRHRMMKKVKARCRSKEEETRTGQ